MATADDQRRRSWRMRLLWWASLVTLAAVLVPVTARATGWEAGPLVVIVSLMPWVTIACLVPFALALIARSIPLTAAALVPLTLCVAWIAPLYVADGSESGSDSESVALRIMTANLRLGQADAHEVVALVREGSIDVLAVQELSPVSVDALREAGLEELLPHSELLAERGASGTGVWTRSPMTDAEEIEGLASRAVRVEIDVDGKPLAVYAVHPWPPGTRTHRQWTSDMEALATLLDQERGAVLVAGDFNATRDHAPFRRLEALGYQDAADQAGAGFQPTFPQGSRLPPVVAIDHVLTRKAPLVAASVTAVTIAGSDHAALLVTYAGT